MRPSYHHTLLTLVVAVASGGGCAGGPGYPKARKAERAGDYSAAYDAYCSAIRDRPSSATASFALRRVAPLAAREAEQRAHAALDEGRPIEAWRLFMRVLEIQPDHPSAAQLIRRIERDYPSDTRQARARWERDGAIRVARAAPRSADTSNRPKERSDDRVAVADPPQRDEVDRSSPPAPALPTQDVPVTPALRTDDSKPPVAPKTAAAAPTAPEAASSQPTAGPKQGARSASRKPVREKLQAKPQPAPQARDASDDRTHRFGIRHRTPAQPTTPPKRRYVARAIISRDDDRYEKSAELADGIAVEIRDTDEDPLDADIDIYRGMKRIAKHRDVRVGRAIPVMGRSGKRYFVRIITIRDATETITVGIMPTRSSSSGRR